MLGPESHGLLSHPRDHVPFKPCFLLGHGNKLNTLLCGSRSHPQFAGIFLFWLVLFKRHCPPALPLQDTSIGSSTGRNTGKIHKHRKSHCPQTTQQQSRRQGNTKADNLLGRVGGRKIQGESLNYSPNKSSSHGTKSTSICYAAFYRPCLYFPIYKMGTL